MQPTQDLLSTPRRPLDIEDYIDIVRRHKGWLAAPVFAALVLSVVVAFLWPDTYISEASIQVVPPQVPDKLVPTNVSVEMSQRINMMAQSILSRQTLANIIQTHGIYKTELSRRPMEDVIEDMRSRHIKISPVLRVQGPGGRGGSISAFRISFEYQNRLLAQKITQDLCSRFIDENIRSRSSQSVQTTEFLKEQLESTRKELEQLENKLTEFRVRNAGRLPEQLQNNLQAIRAFETQLSGVNDAISRLGQEKLLLESQIRILKDQINAIGSSSDPLGMSVKSERLIQLEREILNLETALSALRERYRDTHPDVKTAESQLAVLKRTRDALLKQEQEKKQEPAPQTPTPMQAKAARDLEAAIARLQSQIEARNLELERRVKEQDQLKQSLKIYNARIEASPLADREYAELTRNYDLAKTRYDELNRKASISEMATDLENRRQGERLELLEPASLPEKPAKPNRLLIVGVGVGMGLMLGVFTTGARELKDTSLKNLKDARAYTNLPVLGTIPLLQNDLVVRRKRRLTWLAWSAACVLGILAMGGSIYFYYATKV